MGRRVDGTARARWGHGFAKNGEKIFAKGGIGIFCGHGGRIKAVAIGWMALSLASILPTGSMGSSLVEDCECIAEDGNVPSHGNAAAWAGRFWDADYVNGVVATVNDRVITAGELRQELMPLLPGIEAKCRTEEEFRGQVHLLARQILEKMVDSALIVEEFKKSGRCLTDMQKDFQLDEFIRTRFGGDRLQFLAALHGYGKSLQQFRREMEEELIVSWMLSRMQRSLAEISPRQVVDYYEAHGDQFFRPSAVRLGQICFGGKDGEIAAEKMLASLASGADFTTMQRENGGGDGWIAMDDLQPDLVPLVGKTAEGETTGPVQLGDQIALLHVYDRRAAHRATLDEVREEIEQLLLRERLQESRQRWLTGLRQKAHIQILL